MNIDFCYSATMSVSYFDPNSVGSDDKVSGDTDGDGMINGGYLDGDYTCSYEYNVVYNTSITIKGYNQENTLIIHDKVTPVELTKAGTSIGIAIIEKKTAAGSYKDVLVENKNGSCVRKQKYNCSILGDGSFCSVGTEEKMYKVGEQGPCCTAIPGTERNYCTPLKITSGEIYNSCVNHAENTIKNLLRGYVNSQSYQNIKLLNPNDGTTTNDAVTISTNKNCGACNALSCSCIHTYTPKAVCMNKITSDVRYGDACSTDEFQIKNDIVKDKNSKDIEHFHYFVPLNVTNGWFSLILSESGDRIENDRCKALINANPTNFYDFFVGVRANGEIFAFSDNITTAINSLDYGCYIRSEIRIPVSKGLYNVTDNKIKGYNLYVKNVDENNPFPNPVTNLDSLWLDWYKSNYSGGNYNGVNGDAPKIKESYLGEPSYKLENVNAKKIRKLNSNLGNYLKSSLNENGSSDFIRNEIVFDKIANSNSYYKIGCGPLNSTETISDGINIIENPLYQEGCK